MTTATRHECPDCETIFIGSTACPNCGWAPSSKPKVAEQARPWVQPVYDQPPASREHVRDCMALIRKVLEAPRPVYPVGTCPKHPEGCGLAGPTWKPGDTT